MLPESETCCRFQSQLKHVFGHVCVCVYFKDCHEDIIINFLLICLKYFLVHCKFYYKNNKASSEIAACSNIKVYLKTNKQKKHFLPLELERKNICAYFILKLLPNSHQKSADLRVTKSIPACPLQNCACITENQTQKE